MIQLAPKPSLFAHVLDRLGSQIVAGTYEATGLLPREQDLCAMMGASRTVIREVVRVLGQKGLVSPQQRVGVRIMPSTTWNLMDFDVLDWIWRGGHHERYIRDFLEFRLAMEPVSSYQAALRASPEARKDIVARYHDLLGANQALNEGGDRQLAIETDIGFHTAIFLASGNHLARYLGALVTHIMRRQVDETTEGPGEFARGLHLHGAVAEAIAAGDAQSAFNSSYQLVRMPYDLYMQRAFPGETYMFPDMMLPSPARKTSAAK
jgi:DNA-binding FadR family transcriptional regulator